MRNRKMTLRIAGPIVGGAATIALVPVLPAVGQQSPPVGGQSRVRVAVCHNGKTLTLPAPAADAHMRHGDTAGLCAGG
jgi:hypothetical protein